MGRKYCTTAYYHEQGTDVARGLLLRDEADIIGEGGYMWLMISIASNWAGNSGLYDDAKTDKIPLKDRFYWAENHIDELLMYGSDPLSFHGWMKADKPWQFLAGCDELVNIVRWEEAGNDKFEFVSNLEVYIDG